MNEKNMKKPYFNEDINSKIKDMTPSDRDALLLSLEGTKYWIAILKYCQDRTNYCQNGLLTTDATKEPGKICQLQGVLMGISDLQNAVITLKERSDSIENQAANG